MLLLDKRLLSRYTGDKYMLYPYAIQHEYKIWVGFFTDGLKIRIGKSVNYIPFDDLPLLWIVEIRHSSNTNGGFQKSIDSSTPVGTEILDLSPISS